MMKSINRLLFAHRWQECNLLLLRTPRPICRIKVGRQEKNYQSHITLI